MPTGGGAIGVDTDKTIGKSALQDEVSTRAVGEDTESDLVKRMTGATETPETTLSEEKERLEEEAGIAGKKEIVGSFEEEISKTQTLLDQLEEDITTRTRDYLVSDPQRRRILASEREPLTKELGILERGYGTAQAGLQREQADILTELGLIEKERTEPLEMLEREINIRSKIKDLTDKDIPNVVSSTFNEEGDLTIVTQDPETGAFSTQTLKGIGEKAQKYQSISSTTDDEGNLTIVGVTRDGKSEILGTFKGVGKTVTSTSGAITTLNDLAKMGITRKGADDGGWNFFKNGQPITAEEIVQETGVALNTLLAGSKNPADAKKMEKSSQLTRENLSSMFKMPDNDEKDFWGKTNSQRLDELEDIIKQYQDAGYTDAQILKMMESD